MQEVTGKELVCPEKAAVTGPVRVIPIEYRNINCCSIDITLPRAGEEEEDMEIFFNLLQAEFAAGFTDPVIAYRVGYRWEPMLEFRQLQAPPQGRTRLKQGGVYLITGGLGGIGYVLGEDLAKVTDVKLVLTGRQSLPARDLWPKWLQEHHEADLISQKIRKVNALERMGAQVLAIGADVADSQRMQQVKTDVEKQWGPINGVIHAAGVPDGGVIPLRTRENTNPVLAPKVIGTLVLGAVFREVPLDFFVSCSSLTSILVPLGQIGYCAANAVQDAFARGSSRWNGSWGFTGSINWDVWKEVGMGVEAARILQEDEGIADAQFLVKGGILNTEGVTAFHTVMHYAFPQTIISTRDLFVRIREFVAAGLAEPDEIANVEEFSGTTHPRPDLSTEYEPPRTRFEKTFADILTKFFGYEKVGIHDNFFEFGVTSLTIIRINGLLREAINKTIPIVSMFENPTIHSLGQYLEQEEKGETLMDEEIEELLDLESSEELLYDSIDLLREDEDE
jgi:NAD(P)-dependent dehydrogenase (short-subunit alcohol dehydrogenase family)